jgi:CheY-like chemotaxis protein
MPKNGPILIIEDDIDDQFTLKKALSELNVWNELVFFENGPAAFEYLNTVTRQPFLIICDVNLPIQSGIEFKKDVDNNPAMRAMSIPFIFYSTYVSQFAINEAYKNLTIQGFFQKNNSYQELKDVIKTIIDYWQICKQPVFKEKANIL